LNNDTKYDFKILKVLLAHTCNHSYSGAQEGEVRRIMVQSKPGQKKKKHWHDSPIPLLDTYPKELKGGTHGICVTMFTKAFIIYKKPKVETT
jgi:hypothetical protein